MSRITRRASNFARAMRASALRHNRPRESPRLLDGPREKIQRWDVSSSVDHEMLSREASQQRIGVESSRRINVKRGGPSSTLSQPPATRIAFSYFVAIAYVGIMTCAAFFVSSAIHSVNESKVVAHAKIEALAVNGHPDAAPAAANPDDSTQAPTLPDPTRLATPPVASVEIAKIAAPAASEALPAPAALTELPHVSAKAASSNAIASIAAPAVDELSPAPAEAVTPAELPPADIKAATLTDSTRAPHVAHAAALGARHASWRRAAMRCSSSAMWPRRAFSSSARPTTATRPRRESSATATTPPFSAAGACASCAAIRPRPRAGTRAPAHSATAEAAQELTALQQH